MYPQHSEWAALDWALWRNFHQELQQREMPVQSHLHQGQLPLLFSILRQKNCLFAGITVSFHSIEPVNIVIQTCHVSLCDIHHMWHSLASNEGSVWHRLWTQTLRFSKISSRLQGQQVRLCWEVNERKRSHTEDQLGQKRARSKQEAGQSEILLKKSDNYSLFKPHEIH